jgi:hypothetical protein
VSITKAYRTPIKIPGMMGSWVLPT